MRNLHSLFPRIVGSMRLLHNITSILSLDTLSTNISPSISSDVSLASRIPLNETVGTEVRRILAHFASATFRKMELVPIIGPTTDPELLLGVRLIFSLASGTLYVDMTDDWGEWGAVSLLSIHWPAGDNSLPSRLVMDVVYADELKNRAGYVEPYRTVNLGWPRGLRTGREQPYYCFVMDGNDPKRVYVGVNDQTVLTSLPWAREGAVDNGASTA